jgi:DNA-binding NtrC family response regulator
MVEMDKFKALFVDDEVEFQKTIIKRMKKRNIDAAGAQSGDDAIEWLKDHSVDVIVLDVKMPGMDGIQTLREIKNIWPTVEVIMLTGHANLETASEGMAMGAFDYIMKPVDIDELLYKMQDACKQKTLQEAKNKNLPERKTLREAS